MCDAVERAGYDQVAALANAASQPGRNVFAEPPLTVRHSTAPSTFARNVACADLHRVLALDRTLTNGYSIVRRTRRTSESGAVRSCGTSG